LIDAVYFSHFRNRGILLICHLYLMEKWLLTLKVLLCKFFLEDVDRLKNELMLLSPLLLFFTCASTSISRIAKGIISVVVCA